MKVSEFEHYFKRLYLPLCMYALRITNDTATAEDVVQETFISAWQWLDSGGETDNFKSFMYRSVRNTAISHLRREDRYVALDMGEFENVSDEIIDTSERDARIWTAIDKLPATCREVFLMSKRDGLTNEEIAEELNISINTVKNHIAKAYNRLRDDLSAGVKVFFMPFL